MLHESSEFILNNMQTENLGTTQQLENNSMNKFIETKCVNFFIV